MDDMMTEATITAKPLVKTIFLEAAPEMVWQYLTKQEHLGKWYQPAHGDLAEGQAYALGKDGQRQVWGEVQHWDPPHKLVTTFEIGPFAGQVTTVTWALEALGDGTFLTVTHEGIPAGGPGAGALPHLDRGWDAHFAALRDAVG